MGRIRGYYPKELVVRSGFSGKGDGEITFKEKMAALCIHNKGIFPFTFTTIKEINGSEVPLFTFTLDPGETFYERIELFQKIKIKGKGYGGAKYGGWVSYLYPYTND
ncbi:hypothetical protein ACFSL6_23935 [Paenibacillus thailandensis]|uniref:hypothetical protein n=1 Tax=Paenibacillus thailandensis TaxID=393250 RepID=UPI00362592CE